MTNHIKNDDSDESISEEVEQARAENRQALSTAAAILDGLEYSSNQDDFVLKLLAAFEAVVLCPDPAGIVATALWWTLEGSTTLDINEVHPHADGGTPFVAFAHVAGLIQTAEHLDFQQDGLVINANPETIRLIRSGLKHDDDNNPTS